MLRHLTPFIAGSVLSSVILTGMHPASAQPGAQRALDLLDVVSTARGLGNTPIKDGGGNPPPADDDGDGVANDADRCPNTPQGAPVDNEGCSASQKDDDNDGVSNDSDICPNTPEGEAVDGNGCGDSQKDDDNDGVANTIDLCPNTPEGEDVDSDGCSESQLDPEAAVRQVYGDDVNPLIVSAQGGCTGSGCHGRAGAPGGLRLYGAGEDNSTQRNYDSFTSYIGRESAARLLSKLSGGLGHGGGTRYVAGEADYNTIAAWAESVEALLP